MKDLGSYDLEPVRYCSRCYSLRVGYVGDAGGTDYCMDCGSTDISEARIGEWERLYKERYGHDYLERKQDPMRARIYGMAWKDLRQEFYSSPCWMEIVKAMYPKFPKYKCKEDAMLAFINRIEEDGKVDEFKERMYIHCKEQGR